MTREEVKDLLKFIIRKCDLIINNENYTADDYVQDKVEDVAEMCHMVLDELGCIENEDVSSMRACLESQKEHDHEGKKWIREKDYYEQLDAQYMQGFEDGRKEQQPAEWSDEDERKYQCIRCILLTDADKKVGSWKYSEILEWYEKRGIGRYTNSKPHTVSTKDATKFGNLEYERGVKDGMQSEKSRQWKPSEEQMKWLKDVIETVPMTCRQQVPLESLYTDLQKLL